uniref:Uncharacterized protein n=1 Tax=Knipowitschia caucasica TaxID=637954 RepID=A0AAV2KB50_KNICA
MFQSSAPEKRKPGPSQHRAVISAPYDPTHGCPRAPRLMAPGACVRWSPLSGSSLRAPLAPLSGLLWVSPGLSGCFFFPSFSGALPFAGELAVPRTRDVTRYTLRYFVSLRVPGSFMFSFDSVRSLIINAVEMKRS